MAGPEDTSQPGPPRNPSGDRLESWKEIAAYLKRGVTTVQRWEKEESLPVRRHLHHKLGSVYAFRRELDDWWARRGVDLDAKEQGRLAETSKSDEHPSREVAPRRFRRWQALGALLGVVALALTLLLQSRGPKSAPDPTPSRMVLAVLPFANLSGSGEHAYLSDSLTEEIITHLARLNPVRLGVIARTSVMPFKDSRKGVAEIGRELGADYILEGSVQVASRRLHVSAQLIRVRGQTHVWAEHYDRELNDVIVVQCDIAEHTAHTLELALLPGEVQRMARMRVSKPEAVAAYLKGRYLLSTRRWTEFLTARDYFERAIAEDPTYAPAYTGLADSYILLANYGIPPMTRRFRRQRRRPSRPSSWTTRLPRPTLPWPASWPSSNGTSPAGKENSPGPSP